MTRRTGKNYRTMGHLLDRIRDLYLDSFFEAIESCREDVSVKVFAEAAYTTSYGDVIGEGPLGLPLRIDIATVEGVEG